nr:deoxyribonuclease-1-like isoform X1 [Gasterosteus aculeatus aculeatus]
MTMRWVCALGLLSALLHLSTSLLLGAFNIRIFGAKKASNNTLMDIIATVVCRYDIILIQEVRDSHLTVTNKLKDLVNTKCPTYNANYSAPLGTHAPTNERYVFLFREPQVSVVDSYQYVGTAFTRPPYIVKFSSTHTAVKEFVLIPQHTRPEDAVEQINALCDVVDDVISKMKTQNVVLLGDFNAGCTYVKGDGWKHIRLFTEKRFHWLIDDTQFTSVASDCPYDRIVVTDVMIPRVTPNTALVYRYDHNLTKGHGLLTKQEVLAVSDHYPVEVELN